MFNFEIKIHYSLKSYSFLPIVIGMGRLGWEKHKKMMYTTNVNNTTFHYNPNMDGCVVIITSEGEKIRLPEDDLTYFVSIRLKNEKIKKPEIVDDVYELCTPTINSFLKTFLVIITVALSMLFVF